MTVAGGGYWVIGLCADWCHVCRGMKPDFDQMPSLLPDARWVWLDIEDHDDLLGDLDITTFPTYLIASDEGIHLLAPGPTKADALARFVAPYLRQAVAPMAHDETLSQLLGRVRERASP